MTPPATDLTLGDAFPSLRAERLPTGASLAMPFDLEHTDQVERAVAIIGELLCERRSVDAIHDLAIGLLDDLERLWDHYAAHTELETDLVLKLELIEFLVCGLTAEAIQDRGERLRTAAWLHRALHAPVDDSGWQKRFHRVGMWPLAPGLLRPVAAEATLRYLTALYAHAWATEEFDEWADLLWTFGDKLLEDESLQDPPLPVDVVWRVNMSAHRAQWATRSGSRDARAAFAQLLPLLDDAATEPHIRKMIQSFAAFCEVQVTERSQEAWARELLAEHDGNLSPPLLLRAICSACGNRIDDLVEQLPRLLEVARDHRTFDGERTIVERGYRRSQDAKAMSWAVRSLVLAGRDDDAMRLLDAWAPTAARGPLLRHPLFVFPTAEVGTLWAAGGHAEPPPDGPEPGTLTLLNAATDKAFTTGMPLRSDMPVGMPHPSDRLGVPQAGGVAEFERIAREHLRLDCLAQLLPECSPDAALIPWPMLAVPIQALILQALGRALPLCASLCEPEPCRPLRRAVVMGSGSLSSELERTTVAEILTAADVHVDVVEHASADAFRRAYADPSLDLLWLCSHATQDHALPHRSGLELDDGVLLSLGELSALPALQADSGRRLLALNVCDAADSARLGGALTLGVAAVLAGPRQSVISHLWPVHFVPAGAFGALLADALTRLADHTDAYAAALTLLGGGRAGVLAALEQLGPAGAAIAARVRDNELAWDALTTWGSPALVV